jgi:hypothetical protein
VLYLIACWMGYAILDCLLVAGWVVLYLIACWMGYAILDCLLDGLCYTCLLDVLYLIARWVILGRMDHTWLDDVYSAG